MNFLTKMYVHMQSHLSSKMRDEEGATMVEYALMVALIAVVAIGTVTALGVNVDGKFAEISTAIGG